MKLEKITEPKPRWYDDACGTALALELVGERWSLLIVRELMYGPRRFGELRANLPGISANILTQRLDGLEASGIVLRRRLPPPASVQVYDLTPWGRESEPAIMALGRWAVRSPRHDPTAFMSGASLMMSFRTMFRPDRAAGLRGTMLVRVGPDAFAARLSPEGIDVVRGAPPAADLALEADTPWPILSIVYGGEPVAPHESSGALRVRGDRALLARFVTLFPLPPKIASDVPNPG